MTCCSFVRYQVQEWATLLAVLDTGRLVTVVFPVCTKMATQELYLCRLKTTAYLLLLFVKTDFLSTVFFNYLLSLSDSLFLLDLNVNKLETKMCWIVLSAHASIVKIFLLWKPKSLARVIDIWCNWSNMRSYEISDFSFSIEVFCISQKRDCDV
jgi:hypothetical protein